MPLTSQERQNLRGVDKAKKNILMIKTAFGRDIATIFRRGGLIIGNSAAQIIDAKGHILTGALMRSMTENVQITRVTKTEVDVSVGSHLHYAPKIEMLPDGGFLFEAFEKQRAVVLRYIGDEYKRIIDRNIHL